MTRAQFIDGLLKAARLGTAHRSVAQEEYKRQAVNPDHKRNVDSYKHHSRHVSKVTNPKAQVHLDKKQGNQTTSPLKVGFYGCSNSLVRVGFSGPPKSKAPLTAVVDCPACNTRHGVSNPMWRAAKSFEEWETCEVHLKKEADDAGD